MSKKHPLSPVPLCPEKKMRLLIWEYSDKIKRLQTENELLRQLLSEVLIGPVNNPLKARITAAILKISLPEGPK